MTFRPHALRTVAAATLSLLSLSACTLDAAMLGAVAGKGAAQPGQPGATQPGQPGAAQPGQPGAAQPGKPGAAQPGQPGQPGGALQPNQPGPNGPWAQPGMPGQPMTQPPMGSGGEIRVAGEASGEGAAFIELTKALDADMEEIEAAADEEAPAARFWLAQAASVDATIQPPPIRRPAQPPVGQPGQPPMGQPDQPPMGQPGQPPMPPTMRAGLTRDAVKAAFSRGKRSEEKPEGGGKLVRLEFQLEGSAEAPQRQVKLERKFDAEGKLVAQHQWMRGESADGRRVEIERQKVSEADGHIRVNLQGRIQDAKAGEAEVKWEKRIDKDGKVEGKGVLKLIASGKELPFTFDGFKGIGPLKPGPRPSAGPSSTPSPRSGDACGPEAKRIGLSGKATASTILSITVTDDRMVMGGGASVDIAFTGIGTNLGKGAGCTFVGVYDGGRTSDPSTGGNRIEGALASVPTFAADGLSGSVKIDPARLTAGTSYWLRFSTPMADGTWEVAEGILMAH